MKLKKDALLNSNQPQKETLTCPVCGKNFPPDDDTKYIASGGYTCSWDCFLSVVKKGEAKKKELESKNKQTEINTEEKVEKKTRKTRKNSKK